MLSALLLCTLPVLRSSDHEPDLIVLATGGQIECRVLLALERERSDYVKAIGG